MCTLQEHRWFYLFIRAKKNKIWGPILSWEKQSNNSCHPMCKQHTCAKLREKCSEGMNKIIW